MTKEDIWLGGRKISLETGQLEHHAKEPGTCCYCGEPGTFWKGLGDFYCEGHGVAAAHGHLPCVNVCPMCKEEPGKCTSRIFVKIKT